MDNAITPNLRIVYDEEFGGGCLVEPHQAALVFDPKDGLTLHLPNSSPDDKVPLEVQYLTAMLTAARDLPFVESIVEAFLDQTSIGVVH